ncbi:ankyrin repeat-containing domain protein [Choanephora cucurbitarum]|nr:ankyrin repeat-containing domain protein [Choanephora cucurbitarum]
MSLLPSPPSSPIETVSRKRSYSISFIQNETSQEPIKKHPKMNTTLLKLYLEKHASPNTCDQTYHRSLLSWACTDQSIDSVKQLLQCVQLDINLSSGPNHTTALHEACLSGFTLGVELLLQHPDIDVNKPDCQGRTAVHYAAQLNQLGCLKLLSGRARLDISDSYGQLPIHTATLYGHSRCVQLLLECNSSSQIDLITTVNPIDQRDTLELAIVMGNSHTLNLLLNALSSQPKRSGLVSLAVEWNRIECLQLLLQQGYPIDDNSLLTAVQQRKIDIVRLLVNAGARACLSMGRNPSLLYAANHGFVEMVPFLITLDTSRDCIQQALLLASTISLRDQLSRIIIHTLNRLKNQNIPMK